MTVKVPKAGSLFEARLGRLPTTVSICCSRLLLSSDQLALRYAADYPERTPPFMNPSPAPVTIVFRIPGQWSNPQELITRLPKECRLTPETLTMPDGTEVEFGAMAPDNQFAQIFRTSCRKPA